MTSATMPAPTRAQRATGTTARSSKVYSGSLTLGDATTSGQMDFSCLPTAVAINPPDPPDDSDSGEVLCGDPVEADGGGSTAYGTLTFTSLQDFDDPQGLIAYSWTVARGVYVPYTWVPNPNGLTVTGTVRVWPLTVGGDVGRANRLTADAEWSLGEDPTFTWSTPTPTPTPATGATAGTPGTWTPAGATPPANLTAMTGITASPATAWTAGQYMVLGDSSNAYWDGTAWQTGQAPTPVIPATGATAGTPGTWTPTGATTPANFAAMAGIVADPTTAWTTGQYMLLGDLSNTYWDGTAWQTGQAPAPPATTATAGSPGSFDGTPPANFAAMATIIANPTTAWTTGQYVVLGDTSEAYWDGTAWAVGEAS